MPASADPDRRGPRDGSSVTATSATAAQPSPNRPSSVSSDPNTTNTPSLTISTMSIGAVARTSSRRSRPADAEHDRAHEHGDQPVALGRQPDRDAVGREGRAERVERLLRASGMPALDAAPARHRDRRQQSDGHARTRSRASRPGARTATTRTPPRPAPRADERGREARARPAALRPSFIAAGLEVQRVADDPRHARVRDHRGGQDWCPSAPAALRARKHSVSAEVR